MESFVHLRKGKTPHRLHADLDGLKDDELGRGGFTGRTANIYRRHDPTAYRSSGPLRPVDVLSSELKPGDATDAHGGPLLMFSNDDCRILLSRRHEPMPYFTRHVDGDLLSFVHQGTGLVETEFGPLRYREGDWVYLPKACTWRQVPDRETTWVMIEATDEFRVPSPRPLGRHFPFDPSQATIPEPAPIEDDGRDEYEVRLIHEGGPTTLVYQYNPLDIEGWRGDNFAFTFNIDDYNVITSDSVHLPPTVHLFMQATGVYVMNFLPKPAEGVPGTERTPWSPQRRLRRNRVLPRRLALRRPDAAGPDYPCAARASPRRAGESARTCPPQIRRAFAGRLAGHRRRHPQATDPVTRSTGPRPGAALMTTAVKHDYERIPYLVAFQNDSGVRDVYDGLAEITVLESYLLKPKDKPSDTVLVFMHPIGGGAYLPMINALARAGHHVIYCNSRFRGTDSALLMEKVVEDLGECIKDAKNRLGYSKVVLAGWSGGGSLSVFYQQQAQHATITSSPTGDGPDLTKLELPAADGIMLLAAHISRHGTLTEWLDASILDEFDPTKRDPELDLYNPDNPNRRPIRRNSWTSTVKRRSTATAASPHGSKRSWLN